MACLRRPTVCGMVPSARPTGRSRTAVAVAGASLSGAATAAPNVWVVSAGAASGVGALSGLTVSSVTGSPVTGQPSLGNLMDLVGHRLLGLMRMVRAGIDLELAAHLPA